MMKTTDSLTQPLALGLLVLSLAGVARVPADTLKLAEDGVTAYRVVEPTNDSPVDAYASATLTKYLHQITGAQFPVVEGLKAGDDSPALFVGLSDAATKRLAKPLAGLDDLEHVACSIGGDIFLYGKGIDAAALTDAFEIELRDAAAVHLLPAK